MSPLSTFTYWRRHKGRTGLILGLIAFSTLGLYAVITAVLILFNEPFPASSTILRNASFVFTFGQVGLDPGVVAQLRAHPDIARVVPDNGYNLGFPSVMADQYYAFDLLALNEADIAPVMEANGVRLKEGRLLQPRHNEFMLAEEVAAALNLHLGDEISRETDEIRYREIQHPLRLVGILQGEVRLGIASAEYINSFGTGANPNFRALVLAKPGGASVVDAFLRNEIASNRTQVFTLSMRDEDRVRSLRTSITLFAPIALFLSLVLMLVIGMIQRMDLLRRLPELGMLHVIGLQKSHLLRRLTLENAGLALFGWLIGILLPMALLKLLIVYFLAPRGYFVNALQAPAFWLTTPIPLAVMLFTFFSLRRLFARLDGIALVEHGELPASQQPQHAQHSRPITGNPHASWTFYQRHRPRTLLLIGAMTLMIMAVAMIAFLFSTSMDAALTGFGDLRLMTQVSLTQISKVSGGVAAQLRTHPTIERVIPTKVLWSLTMDVPPFSRNSLSTFAVGEADLRYLVDLYGLQIKAGHLPEPRTNQLIIAEAVAQNHNLKVGDRLGDHNAPAYADAPTLPTPFVIAGIFARATVPAEENWLSFASVEFAESHEAYGKGNDFLVVAKSGQKGQMDEWLEQNIASTETLVSSYQQELGRFRREIATVLTTIGLIEGSIALIAAVALGVLNYIFVGQRQAEFGVLHALGFGRRWLLRRTVRESFFTSALAWGLSVLLCLIGLLYMQYGLFQPRGLSLNFFNPTPWYFTLPVPLAVLLTSAVTVNRFLKRLDPVAVIEKA